LEPLRNAEHYGKKKDSEIWRSNFKIVTLGADIADGESLQRCYCYSNCSWWYYFSRRSLYGIIIV